MRKITFGAEYSEWEGFVEKGSLLREKSEIESVVDAVLTVSIRTTAPNRIRSPRRSGAAVAIAYPVVQRRAPGSVRYSAISGDNRATGIVLGDSDEQFEMRMGIVKRRRVFAVLRRQGHADVIGLEIREIQSLTGGIFDDPAFGKVVTAVTEFPLSAENERVDVIGRHFYGIRRRESRNVAFGVVRIVYEEVSSARGQTRLVDGFRHHRPSSAVGRHVAVRLDRSCGTGRIRIDRINSVRVVSRGLEIVAARVVRSGRRAVRRDASVLSRASPRNRTADRRERGRGRRRGSVSAERVRTERTARRVGFCRRSADSGYGRRRQGRIRPVDQRSRRRRRFRILHEARYRSGKVGRIVAGNRGRARSRRYARHLEIRD